MKKLFSISFLLVLASNPAIAGECRIEPPSHNDIGIRYYIYSRAQYPDRACHISTGSWISEIYTGSLSYYPWNKASITHFSHDDYFSSRFVFESDSLDLQIQPNCEGERSFVSFPTMRIIRVLTRRDGKETRSPITVGINPEIRFEPIGSVPNNFKPPKLICSPPPNNDDYDCPDLNLTIRGTLLPVRRGTARVSGDWCQ